MSSCISSHFPAVNPQGGLVRRLFRQLALAGMFAWCTTGFAADAPLTLADAQRRAVERSRQLQAQDFAVASSREMAVVAARLPDPVLKIGIDNVPVNGPERFSTGDDFMTMRRVGIAQEITRSDKRQLRAERFEREADKATAEKNFMAAAIERDAALAWFDCYYAEAMAAVVAEQAAQAQLEIQAAEGSYRAGRGSQADIFVARSALALVADRSSDIQRRIRNARTMLVRWAGSAGHLPLAGKPATDNLKLETIDPLDGRLTHHPQIVLLAQQEKIAVAEARLAQADKRADWTVEVMYSQRGPAYSNMISVGVSVPLQWDSKNRQDRTLSAKLAQVEQAGAQREEALRAHVAELGAMIDEWKSARERRARYDASLVPLAKQRTQAVFGAYSGGKSTLAELLAARRNEIDVRLQALQWDAESSRLWTQINYLILANSNAVEASAIGEPK